MGNFEYPAKLNVAKELIDNNTAKRGDKVFIYTAKEEITFNQLSERVNKFANVLKGLGVNPGERVMIVLPDIPLFYCAFLGSIKAGAIPIPINNALKEDDYKFLLNDSEASVLITTSDNEAKNSSSTSLKHKLLAETDIPALLKKAGSDFAAYPSKEDDIAFWLYSSGSTGKPKGVLHRHRDILFTADTFAKSVVNLTDKDIVFSASKLFFAYGLGNSLSFPLRFGASVVILDDKPSPENVIDLLSKYKPTVFCGVPTLFNSMLKRMGELNLKFLRICISAGEALPPEIYRKWLKATGLELLDGIGSTEALHIFISNMPNAVKENSTGKLVPGYEARVIDDENNDVPEGEQGHLIIRGKSVTPGYWKRPSDNEEKMMPDGWFKTGDMYSMEDGYFYYQGRGDDMLKVGGIWVSPMEIENIFLSHQAVHECAVVGSKVEGLVKPFAYVVLNSGEDKNKDKAKDLLSFAQSKLPKHKWPWEVYFIDALPRTTTGKVQRFKLRQTAPVR